MLHEIALRIKNTSYRIDLTGRIYNINTDAEKQPYLTNTKTLAIKIYDFRFQCRRRVRGKLRKKGAYRTYSVARLLIDTFFSVGFKYKIDYKDGNKMNCSLDNLILRQTKKEGTHYIKGLEVDLIEFLPLIERNMKRYPYEKLLIVVD